MSEWKECKLGDVVSSNNRSIGREYLHRVIKYLDTGSITRGKINGIQELNLTEAPSRAKRLVQNNDIVYSTVRPIQRHYGFIVNPEDNFVVSTGFTVLETNQKLADPMFVYYFLTTNEVVEELDVIAEASTTTYPSLKPADIENLDIFLPSCAEQKAIVGVLSSLDDKIDLLHRQNKTLEAMAETLFRQWFVEEESNGTIFQLIDVQNGYAFKSKDFKEAGSDGVVKIKNISNGMIDIINTDYIDNSIVDDIQERFKIVSGDILIAMTGAEIGKLGIIPQTGKLLLLNQRVGLLKEKYKGSKYLAYLQLKSDFGQDYIENTATGSAQPNISGVGIENCGFPKLSEKQLENHSFRVGELYERVIFNLGQIRTLEKLRDTLLPKLMSGEVRVAQ